MGEFYETAKTGMRLSFEGLKSISQYCEDVHYKFEPDTVQECIMTGAQLLVEDVSRLPRPRSKINSVGYTHLLDSIFADESTKDESVYVCWGKHYGPFVENGTHSSKGKQKGRAQPHLKGTFDQNPERYYRKIMDELNKRILEGDK